MRYLSTATAALVGALALHSTTASAACNGYVGITFDDGPTSNTATLVNLLKQNSLTPVTWFNWGQRVSSNPSLIAQELTVGEVQNHSNTHPHMSGYTSQQVINELSAANQAIQNAGAPKPTLYRAPYGELNTTIRQAASSLGLFAMTWDVDSGDWNGASTAAIVSANNQLQNGQVILMHDGYANTNNAIAQIAANLRARNMCPGRIDPTTGRAVAPAGGTTPPPGGGTGTITVRARGVAGGEADPARRQQRDRGHVDADQQLSELQHEQLGEQQHPRSVHQRCVRAGCAGRLHHCGWRNEAGGESELQHGRVSERRVWWGQWP
jgi:peptidoglycan/xylan/chitin deacetylase (PgdA/CDA1 family)